MHYKTKKFICLTFILFFALSAAPVTSVHAAAKPPQAVTDTSTGIIQLVLSCADDAGNTHYLHQGTGFLVGSTEENQYIITNSQTITPDKAELNQIRKWNGLGPEAKLTPQIQILLAPDISINATVVSQGSDLPYALLTPSSPINGGECLKLSSVASASKKQAAYLYGYDFDMSLMGLTEVSASAPVLHTGSITFAETDPAAISTDIEAESGCAGAPLLDKNGYVLGMFYHTQDNLEVLPADTIKVILKTLNINYRTTDPNSDYNVADDTIQKELSTLLSKCQQDVTKNSSKYSAKTLSNYKTAISNAMNVIASPQSTRDNYQESIDALTKAREKLRPKNFTKRIVQLALLAVLLVLGFLNLTQLRKSKNFLTLLHPKTDSEKDNSVKTAPAALVRMDTRLTIPLNKRDLRIGKDDAQVDYCITDNPAISRYHAAILYKDNRYYIIDNHSTNHTCVNHSVIQPNCPVALKDGDFISLADIPFQLHINS